MDNSLDELAKLGELRKNGVLTEEEFQERKKQILARSTQPQTRTWDPPAQSTVPADQASLRATSNAPAKRRKRKGFLRQVLTLFVFVLIIAAIFGVANKGKRNESPTTPNGGSGVTTTTVEERTELCAALRDPQNAVLGVSDFADILGVSEGYVRQYVAERCPELLIRVS